MVLVTLVAAARANTPATPPALDAAAVAAAAAELEQATAVFEVTALAARTVGLA